MWMAILAGVGAGLLVAIMLIMRQEKRYRVLFSDTHLAELAVMLERARTGAPATTFEGVTLAWERMPGHVAVTLSSKAALAAPAARFLLAFVRDLVGAGAECQGLQLDKRSFAALWVKGEVDPERAVVAPEGDALVAMRQRAAESMKSFAVVDGSLSAYR